MHALLAAILNHFNVILLRVGTDRGSPKLFGFFEILRAKARVEQNKTSGTGP